MSKLDMLQNAEYPQHWQKGEIVSHVDLGEHRSAQHDTSKWVEINGWENTGMNAIPTVHVPYLRDLRCHRTGGRVA